MVDLGAWLREEYRIPGAILPDEEPLSERDGNWVPGFQPETV